ncbi:imidazolonepropionase [Natrarchaeobius sp. A-rgal3]|uniref:imidazolonepropionase n=1 Tax=Natrarchaeobius versutus TaxID=1679078 RepID=UPI00350F2AA8
MSDSRYTIVHGASEVVVGPADSVDGNDEDDGNDGEDDESNERGGADSSPIRTVSDAAVVVADGAVVAVGSSDDLGREYPPENAETAIDANGRCVLPGFVDPHTHAIFAGDRSDEFEAKLRGKSYQEILAEGGGILRTVRAVRETSEDELVADLRDRLDTVLAHGTTTIEVKSGYGLAVDAELKLLSAIDRAGEGHPVDVVPTFMGAHAVPDGSDAETYTDRVIEDQLPAVADQGIADCCDVFCEDGAFSLEQSRRILEAGRKHGLVPKIHADEFERLGGVRLAADLPAASADHLLRSTDEDVDALFSAGVTPVFLPGTAFGLGGEYPSLEPYRERGAIPAIGSDFNPNCYAPSMGFAATLACVGVGMTPAEAILGITARGADALKSPDGFEGTGGSGRAGGREQADGRKRTDRRGTLEPGSPADLVVIDAPSYRHLPYVYDVNIVETVLKGGEVVA